MKQTLIVLMMVLGITSYSQSTEPMTYVTPQRDTMYVVANMFPTMKSLWNQPSYKSEKPVLIPVESIFALKTSLGIKED